LVALFEVARGHHQQLTSFSNLIVLGALGFAVTDTFRHIYRNRKFALPVALIGIGTSFSRLSTATRCSIIVFGPMLQG
jgi:hypothetical protein